MNDFQQAPKTAPFSQSPIGGDDIPPFTRKTIFSVKALERLRRVCSAIKRLRVVAVPNSTGRVVWSDNGVILEVPSATQSTGGGGPADVTELAFQSWGFGGDNDYITCTGGVQVHLPPLLRFSNSIRTVRNVTINYSAYDPSIQQRIATVGASSIVQLVTPAYVVGDLIYVASVGGVLQDLNVDGRVFAGPST